MIERTLVGSISTFKGSLKNSPLPRFGLVPNRWRRGHPGEGEGLDLLLAALSWVGD